MIRWRQRSRTLFIGVSALALVTAAACGAEDDEARSTTLRIAYQVFGGTVATDAYFTEVKQAYERANPEITVELVPVTADGDDYFTKLNLMRGAPSTAPDVIYQDTFQINSDVEAGFLTPLDDYLEQWDDWDQFEGSAAATQARDGQIYGVPTGTDTRALWYNKHHLRAAGIDLPWRPQTWEDVLEAARAVREAQPDVIPLNVYAGAAAGEVTSMQGLEMLLYGTGDELYDGETEQWMGATDGLRSSFEFVQTVYSEGLGPPPNVALDPNIQSVVASELLPDEDLAIALDGSWLPTDWGPDGATEWPEWDEKLGVAPMPTEQGQGPGVTSMSGGWALAINDTAPDKDLAFDFISFALNEENSIDLTIRNNQIAIRSDVARDPEYLQTNPTVEFFSDLVSVTHFRPAFPEYPRVSNVIQERMEAVMTGDQTPSEAAEEYADEVRDIVGDEAIAATKGRR